MNDASFKRVKHGHVPGDIGKLDKIAMRENPSKSKRAKGFNRDVMARTKARLRRRTEKEILRGLEETL